MDNFLEEYLKQKYRKSIPAASSEPGPVITISREFGCEAKALTRLLIDQLNQYHRGIEETDKWELISKEILEESANKLQTDENRLEYVFNFENRTQIDEFFMSMTSKHYHSDWKIREAVQNVVRAFAYRGHAVILGRAGAQITHDIKKSLHVRLVAPVSWRTEHVMKKYQTTEKLAAKKVEEMDSNRQRLIEMFTKNANCDYCYDVYYNVASLHMDQIISDIIHMMQVKKLI